MAFYIITLIVAIASIALTLFMCGARMAYNKVIKRIPENDEDSIKCVKSMKADFNGLPFYGILMFFWFIAMFAVSHCDVRNKWIDEYRDGKIIERIDYKYNVVNGEKVLKDSTITYERLKD